MIAHARGRHRRVRTAAAGGAAVNADSRTQKSQRCAKARKRYRRPDENLRKFFRELSRTFAAFASGIRMSLTEHRQHPGIPIQVAARDFAAREEAHERHVAQCPPHDLHFRARAAEVRAAAAGAADVHRAGDGTRRCRRGKRFGSVQRTGDRERLFLGL